MHIKKNLLSDIKNVKIIEKNLEEINFFLFIKKHIQQFISRISHGIDIW